MRRFPRSAFRVQVSGDFRVPRSAFRVQVSGDFRVPRSAFRVQVMFTGLTSWFLAFARCGALFLSLPIFSAHSFPARLRVALAGSLAFLIVPSLPVVEVSDLTFWNLIRLLFVELSVGLLLGFVCRLFFFALDVAGAIVSAEIGLTLPAEFNQFTGSSSMAPAVILYWMGVMVLFSLDLHHWIIAGFQRSYALVPMGGGRLSEALLLDVVARSGKVFLVALQISAPLVATSFMVSLVFSVLSRAVPQMNVFAESYPVRTLAGLTVFGLTCTFMGQHLANSLRKLPDDMLNVARLVGG
jgi:flagellar biosynthetic protein FliR